MLMHNSQGLTCYVVLLHLADEETEAGFLRCSETGEAAEHPGFRKESRRMHVNCSAQHNMCAIAGSESGLHKCY